MHWLNMAQDQEPKPRLLKHIQVEGQRMNIWQPIPFSSLVPWTLDPFEASHFLPNFDVQAFTLPDPHLFKTTDCYSDDELRGFVLRNDGINQARIGEDAEYVMYKGRALRDFVQNGVAIPRDARFLILQAYFDQQKYDDLVSSHRIQLKKTERESRRQLSSKDLKPYSGKIRLL